MSRPWVPLAASSQAMTSTRSGEDECDLEEGLRHEITNNTTVADADTSLATTSAASSAVAVVPQSITPIEITAPIPDTQAITAIHEALTNEDEANKKIAGKPEVIEDYDGPEPQHFQIDGHVKVKGGLEIIDGIEDVPVPAEGDRTCKQVGEREHIKKEPAQASGLPALQSNESNDNATLSGNNEVIGSEVQSPQTPSIGGQDHGQDLAPARPLVHPPPQPVLSLPDAPSEMQSPSVTRFLEVEARLVEDEPPAPQTQAPVYPATIIQETEEPWWKRHQRCALFGGALVLCVSVAVLATLLASGSGDDKGTENDNDIAIEAEGGPANTAIDSNSTGEVLLANFTAKPETVSPSTSPSENPSYTATTKPAIWLRQNLTIRGDAAGDKAGLSVDLSDDGTILAIGAPGEASNDRPGYVRVYKDVGVGEPDWKQLGLDIRGDADSDIFGMVVSLSSEGTILAVGAPGQWQKADRPGYVRLFSLEDADEFSWKQLGQDIIGKAKEDEFGTSVSLSADGTTVAIGASGNDNEMGNNAGQVKVFRINHDGNSTTWIQLGQEINGELAYDYAGMEIALSGNGKTLAIASYYNDGNGDQAGHVRCYDLRDGVNGTTWEKVGQDINGDGSDDLFGRSVALSADGKTLAVSATAVNHLGYVRVYTRDDTSSFQQIGQDIDEEEPDDQFGVAVDLSSDGTIVAIGGNGATTHSGGASGHVKVYRIDGTRKNWRMLGQVIDGEAPGDNSGWSVSLSADGETLAIGSVWNSDIEEKAGHVRVFELEN